MTGRRVLIVGAGAMGAQHAAAVRATGDEVTVVVDADRGRAAALAPEAVVATTLGEGLALFGDRFELAVIASPSAVHLEQATELAAAGIPVLVEKPHRIPGQDPSSLLALEREHGPRVFVGMSSRHTDGFRVVADAIADGRLGDVISYSDRTAFALPAGALPPWYFDRAVSGGGVLLTNGVHALDRAAAVLGPLDLVNARLNTVIPGHGTEDHALVHAVAGGVDVSIELLWSPYEPVATGLVITGTHGIARVGMDGGWFVRTADDERGGETNDSVFAQQWEAFVAGTPGFGVTDLEPTLVLIERIYREATDA